MKRRSFLAALCAAPFIPKVAEAAENSGAIGRDEVSGNPPLADANIGTVQAGRLRSADGRMTIDLSTGTIQIA